jgi:hypothetical protein
MTLDLTHIPLEYKKKITHLAGNVIDNSEQFTYPMLSSVGGYLEAQNATSFSVPALSSVGGSLEAESATTFSAPALSSVGEYLSAENATTFSAPVLTSVGGSLYANNATTFSAPVLTSVGGDLNVESATSFSAPTLTNVNTLYLSNTLKEYIINPQCDGKITLYDSTTEKRTTFNTLSDFFTAYPQYRQTA